MEISLMEKGKGSPLKSTPMADIIMDILEKIYMMEKDYTYGIQLSTISAHSKLARKSGEGYKVPSNIKASSDITRDMGKALAGIPQARFTQVDGQMTRGMDKNSLSRQMDPNSWGIGEKEKE